MKTRVALVAVSIVLGALPAFAQVEPGGTFLDDDGSVHEPAIEAIRTAEITQGCNVAGDRFCPEASVTRAEMAAFLIRALGETPVDTGESSFGDVDTAEWYFGSVERLAELGISVGYADGTFRPAAAVSRAEMALFLIRALDESPVDPPTGTFADVSESAFGAGAVERIQQLGITQGCATSPLRYCPFAAVSRAEMASFLARAFELPQEPVPPRPSADGLALGKELVADGLDQPVFVTAPAGDDRLFVIERAGRILVIDDGSVGSTPFLDISERVSTGSERGLLGLAFHPDFGSNGRFFVHYTDNAGDNRVVEFGASGGVADPDSARPLLHVSQPASNHNGGMIAFGPDGRLYVSVGDGGGAHDQYGHGQNPDTVLGTITALDVNSGATSLFAYGVRNPWRFSWDGQRMYIGDVGQNSREEIDVLSTSQAGANLGWPVMEGSLCHAGDCSGSQFVLPVAEYTHAEGCSITGGYVYRGAAVPGLVGHYFYGDFCSGQVWSFRYTGAVEEQRVWPDLSTDRLVSFGVDGSGELYLVSLDGSVWRLVAE